MKRIKTPSAVKDGNGHGHCLPAGGSLPVDSGVRPVRRVQLLFPPMVYPKLQSRQVALFPLGLGYIAAALEQDGYEISLVDCPCEGYETLTDIGKDRMVYGLTPEQIRERIREFRPDVIGISCLFSMLEKRTLMIARIAKEVDPNIVVVCGGPHVSAFYERIIQNAAVDYCVIGEGEETIVELFRAMNQGSGLEQVEALCYRRAGQVVVQPRTRWIENLDELHFPARHLVDINSYFRIAAPQGLRLDGEERILMGQMTTSRGCPFQCTYCGKSITWGKAYRTRSAENVLSEIEHLVDKYGVERIAFQDDNFTADMKRAEKIFDGIIARKLNITWEAPNGLGVNYLSPALLEKMKASGCVSFTVAVESANEKTLRRINKPNYTKLAPPIVAKAMELGIEVRGFFMIGFPGETLEDVMRTVTYARNLNLTVANFSIVTPLPGTELYKECVADGLIDEETLDFEDFAYGGFNLQLAEVPNDQLKEIRKLEWMRTMFLDKNDRFSKDIRLKQEDVLDELAKGLALYPDNEDIHRMYQQAKQHYGIVEGPENRGVNVGLPAT